VIRLANRKGLIAAAGVAAGALAFAPAALSQGAANTVALSGGETALKLNAGTAAVLAENGVSVTPLGRATANGAVDFPITGGRIVPNTGAGIYNHVGSGLRFSAGGTQVNLTAFTINSTAGTITASVGGARVKIADLDTSNAAVIRRGPGRIGTWIVRVQVDLSAEAAAALNQAFRTKLFAEGIPLGRADVRSEPRQVILNGGSTLLAPSLTAANALQSLGVSLGNVPPAAANTAGALNFPIDGKKIDLAAMAGVTANSATGVISHEGGISLSAGSTTVELTGFNINLLRGSANLSSLINGTSRSPILNLSLGDSKVGVSNRQLVVTQVQTTLTDGAASALNNAFSVNAFGPGLDFGTARVQARIR
jgi:hypothetical protein